MPGVRVKVKGGEKLDAKLRKIAAIKAQTRIGFFEKAKYSDGTSVAYVAYLNEYGGHNPPRPFLKRTFTKNIKNWVKGIKANLGSGLSQAKVRRAYEMAGLKAVGDVKRTIKDWNPNDPYPNDNKTIAAKRHRARGGRGLEPINPDTVLIDTGRMIASVNYEVKT